MNLKGFKKSVRKSEVMRSAGCISEGALAAKSGPQLVLSHVTVLYTCVSFTLLTLECAYWIACQVQIGLGSSGAEYKILHFS